MPAQMHDAFFENLKRYVGFTDPSMDALRRFYPIAAPRFASVADDFYGAILIHPDAAAVLGGSRDGGQRIKRTVIRWLDSLLTGPHDQSYFEARARIGHTHVRLKLPQAYIFTAMNRVRVRLLEILRDNVTDAQEVHRIANALHQILDLDLAIVLETYRDDLLDRTRRVERLATIGEFAASIGHELRNPLNVIDGSVYIVGRRYDRLLAQHPALAKHVQRIASEARRANQTIRDLWNLANDRPPRCQPVELRLIVEGAVSLAEIPGTVNLTIEVPSDLRVNVDHGQIEHVIVNLLTNAVQAMNATGSIRVDAAAQAGGRVRLRVSDSGPGIPADIRDRIFDPLFTTKADGSGLGLALSRRIVAAHGGTIHVDGCESGASLVVALPADPGTPTETGAAADRSGDVSRLEAVGQRVANS
jgi:signal transduction histidine kinase